MARLDLEGFRPGHAWQDSLYTRALIEAETDVGAWPVWVYGMYALNAPRQSPRPGESEVHWPFRNPAAQVEPLRNGMHRVFAYGCSLLAPARRGLFPAPPKDQARVNERFGQCFMRTNSIGFR